MLSNYTKQAPVGNNPRIYIDGELGRVQTSIQSIIAILKAVGLPIEIGPADSAGVGFRVLRIPN